MTPFEFAAPKRIRFGRGVADGAAEEAARFGTRVLLVRGSVGFADVLERDLGAAGCTVTIVRSRGEPDLAAVEAATEAARSAGVELVVAVGGGSTIDLGKAGAALARSSTPPLDHLEVVGRGLPLTVDPLPFIALPSTAGTGAEATKNAVIGLPDHGRKVSLRHARMLPDLALVDPVLTDGCPREVTLASGLDAVTQVIEPWLSSKANPLTDAICRDAIGSGLRALVTLMEREDAAARDALAFTSLSGGLALANAGLGAVHGFAGVIGGRTGAAHGAICGRLLPPVLAANAEAGGDPERLDAIRRIIVEVLGGADRDAFDTLEAWIDAEGLPRLGAMGLDAADHAEVAEASLSASSMKGNPVALSQQALEGVLARAA
ncbi:iron-containing alcohol dehydrogenase [Pontivivens ytuae]|uniref:Iron-containing alcohol dehydrogenase n=1 Tax=Pontivivens ytuae TaxID=2789856 RepID=A0A7S9LND2_9RHOB|nr:iron-containing alcohol dehydrogenase [Pontivivens ytuae]QPH52292.1 iron-containing alcohol dehydrogenase [Pontivivens ytuae]